MPSLHQPSSGLWQHHSMSFCTFVQVPRCRLPAPFFSVDHMFRQWISSERHLYMLWTIVSLSNLGCALLKTSFSCFCRSFMQGVLSSQATTKWTSCNAFRNNFLMGFLVFRVNGVPLCVTIANSSCVAFLCFMQPSFQDRMFWWENPHNQCPGWSLKLPSTLG